MQWGFIGYCLYSHCIVLFPVCRPFTLKQCGCAMKILHFLCLSCFWARNPVDEVCAAYDGCIGIFETSVIQLASSRCNNFLTRINISIELPWKPEFICNSRSLVELKNIPQRNLKGAVFNQYDSKTVCLWMRRTSFGRPRHRTEQSDSQWSYYMPDTIARTSPKGRARQCRIRPFHSCGDGF
jgi:hypothetical protein